MTVLGLDPGLDGALAWVHDGGLVALEDMPTLELGRNGRTRNEVNHVALAALIRQQTVVAVYIERVQAMPKQGVSSAFAFGRGTGMLIGAGAMLQVPLHEISPLEWQRVAGVKLRGGKDAARARCLQLWPALSALFDRKKDDGRADAALIAYAGELLSRRAAA